MYKESLFLHNLHRSIVTQTNVGWRGTDGWEKSLGNCKVCDKHWISHFPAGLFLGQLGCTSFLPWVSASSASFSPHCSNVFCDQQVIHAVAGRPASADAAVVFFEALQVASWNHFQNFIDVNLKRIRNTSERHRTGVEIPCQMIGRGGYCWWFYTALV